MIATKEEIQRADTAVENMLAEVQPIINRLSTGTGLHNGSNVDCYMLKAYGLLLQGAHAINTAKALAAAGK